MLDTRNIFTDPELMSKEQVSAAIASEPVFTFEDKLKVWLSEPEKIIRVKDPKAAAYTLDQIFWNTEKHHKSIEFYEQSKGFVKNCIVKYGCEEQKLNEDLPIQCYRKMLEAIDSYYDPYKANVVTFIHKVLFNQIKLRAYHDNKYKDGSFYNRFYSYEKVIKSVVRNITTNDVITLENYFDHLKYIVFSREARNYLEGDLIRQAPKNNILFKAVIWELFQPDEEMKIGNINGRQSIADTEQRRSQIRRFYNIT